MWISKLYTQSFPNLFVRIWLVFFVTINLKGEYDILVKCGVVADTELRQDNSIEEGHGSEEDKNVTFITGGDPQEDPHNLYNPTYIQLSSKEEISKHAMPGELCPPLPESVPPSMALKLCGAVKCHRDIDCNADNNLICCHNGCIHSCMPQVEPPVAFDWLEETDMRFLHNETEYENWEPNQQHDSSSSEENDGGGGIYRKILKHAQTESETIALPGGCLINLQQYEHLIQFRRNQHINSCSCSGGDIVCEVNRVL